MKPPFSRRSTGLCLILSSISLVHDAPGAQIDPLLPPLEGQTFVHDPATIHREGDRYYSFGTGRIIRTLASDDLVHWTNGPSVFAAVPAWTTNAVVGYRGHTWAPDVVKVDGRYLLYYSVSTFGKQVSGIGVASNSTLDWSKPNYRWEDHGPVLLSQEGDPYNAIDPSLFLNRDGRLWMAFGSFWKGLFLVELDPKSGKRLDPERAPKRLAWSQSIEAACLTQHGEDYYLFVNWGRCCRGTNSTYEVRVGRSKSVEGPYLDRDGKDLVEGGGTEFLATEGSFIGPGHIGIIEDGGKTWFSYHYYDARRQGRSHLALGQLEWNTESWPVAKVGPTDLPLTPGQLAPDPVQRRP